MKQRCLICGTVTEDQVKGTYSLCDDCSSVLAGIQEGAIEPIDRNTTLDKVFHAWQAAWDSDGEYAESSAYREGLQAAMDIIADEQVLFNEADFF